MRLLYTLTAYPPSVGGAQFHQHMLARTLLARHSIQVASMWDTHRTDWLLGTTIRASSRSRDYVIDGVPVHRFGLSGWEKLSLAPSVALYYPMMQIALPPIAGCLERHLYAHASAVDVIHNVRIGREALSYASFQVARRRQIPFILTPIHHPRWIGWRYRAYIELYKQADAVIALTEAEKRILVEIGVCEERVTVAGHGPVLAETADPLAFLRSHGLEGPIVLFLGQHYRYKGYRQVLEATKLVWRRVPEAQFVFIGPPVGDSERDFEVFADRRIHRLGKVDLEEKTNALAAASLLCMPSTQESFGGVYTEAWSFAKPVIGCNIPAVANVISDEVDGYLVDQDATQIADRICHLLVHPELAQAMGQAGQHKVQMRYSWDRIGERIEQAYRRAIGS
jgi:glycosyltransferase involved in cell wall biosynthesis